MKRRLLQLLSAVALITVVLLLLLPLRRQHVDSLYLNGDIYTLTDRQPRAEAIAVSGDRIAAVGSTVDLERHFKADTVIDLHRKPIYPGFIDAHLHLEGIGIALSNLDASGKSLEQIQELVREQLAHKTAGQWIRGRGWDQNLWPRKSFPNHHDLDIVTPDCPVYLLRVDGHAVWVNKVVLDLAGITSGTPDPPGGRILRDARGQPTGVFLDTAIDLLASLLPEPTEAEHLAAIRKASEECIAEGITEVHDMGADLLRIGLYKKLAAEGMLPLRLYVALEGTDQKAVETYITSGPEIGLYQGHLTVRAIKLYADGALGSRGAALIEPYSDDPKNRGLTVTTSDELEFASARCVEKGFQLCVHAIGDRANSIVLSAFEKTFNSLKVQGLDKRFRVEHAQVLAPTEIGRFAAIGVIPSMQPVHCTSDMPWAVDRLGSTRIGGAYAWKSLIKAGSMIAGGSDAPVEEPNVIRGFYAAITRERPDGTPAGGWNPPERMSRDEALRSFTIWPAYAAFQEREKGSIEPGKWADFTILSDDIMTIDVRKILDVVVEETVVGGRIVYARDGGK
jgi:predicted amidohydrolase YtcJ